MKPREVFLRSLERKETPRPATGSATSVATVDLMEKVGARFPEAHLDAGKMTDLAAATRTELGFDNVAPLWSVCHESAALGCPVDWGRVDIMPSIIGKPFAVTDEITVPRDFLKRRETAVPLEALSALAKRFGAEAAVVGKVFGPWTLGYHLFGVEDFLINTILDPSLIKRQIERLKEITVIWAHAQIEAGADALCLADHATRDLCSPESYRDFLSEVHAELVDRIACPLILHICGETSDRIKYIRDTGVACFHFDSKVPAAKARELAGERLSLMGGTSNFSVIRSGDPEAVERDVREKLDCKIDIIGPECAVPLDAPYANMRLLARLVRETAGKGGTV